MWGWLKALVAGIVEPLLASWNARKRGQAEEQARNAEAALRNQQALDEAHAADLARAQHGLDMDRLRHAWDAPPAPANGSPQGGSKPHA